MEKSQRPAKKQKTLPYIYFFHFFLITNKDLGDDHIGIVNVSYLSDTGTIEFVYKESFVNLKEFNDVLDSLQRSAEKNKNCFTYLRPWNVLQNLTNTDHVIVVYNFMNNFVQGWCNIKYSIIGMATTIKVEELVTRNHPKISGIGTYILQYIYENCMQDQDILYLFSFQTAIEFYKKIPFLQQYVLDASENKNVFYYTPYANLQINIKTEPSIRTTASTLITYYLSQKEPYESIEILDDNIPDNTKNRIISFLQSIPNLQDEWQKTYEAHLSEKEREFYAESKLKKPKECTKQNQEIKKLVELKTQKPKN